MKIRLPVALAAAALVASACAPQSSTPASSATPVASAGASAGAASSTPSADPCSRASLSTFAAGKLTIGTDKPAYEPWFSNDDPSNGKGFESAVAYAVADRLGFGTPNVTWTTVPFNSSYAPGPKKFDIDINQISITPERSTVVDFSTGYYTVNQAVVAIKGSPLTSATSVADLKGYRFGVQIGTTSLQFVQDVVKPSKQPRVFDNTNDAKSALQNKQVDGIVVDLPTGFYLTAAEIENSVIVGQFAQPDAGAEQFGLLMAKGSALKPCLDKAVQALADDGTLAALQKQWLSTTVSVPVFS